MNARQFVAIQIHAETGELANRELLDFIERAYGISPGDDEVATADWIRDECQISATEHEGAIYLNVVTNGVIQLVRLKEGATRRQVIWLQDCIHT